MNNSKRKICVFLSAFMVFTSYVVSQTKITGNIKDEEFGENQIGVTVSIPDLNIGVVSDVDGNYQMQNIKKGTYLIEVNYLGYKHIVEHITLNGDTTINFKLATSVKELSQVVITGVSRSTELKKAPIIIESLTTNQLQQTSSSNLIDAIKDVPGVNQITTGAAISKPIIRGLGYNRVITLNDGIRQEGQQWGDEHGIEIDEYEVGKVEIIKGPGSLMYGSDGIAGVLNFRHPSSAPQGKVETKLISNYQSNNNLVGYSLSNKGNKNGFQWQGRFSNKYAGNYKNKYDGKILNSGFKEIDGSILLGIVKNWGYSDVSVSTYNNKLGLVEGDRDENGKFVYSNYNGDIQTATEDDLNGYKIFYPYQRINHNRVSSNSYFMLHKGTLDVNLAYQNNRRREFGDPTEPDNIALYFNLNTFNYSIKYNLEQLNGWDISFGVGGMKQSNKNKGLEYLIPEYNLFDIGAFGYVQKVFNKFTFAGGLRIDNRHFNSKELILNDLEEPTTVLDENSKIKFSPISKDYSGLSGSIGLSYQLDNSSVIKFNISQGFRAPNVAELSSNGNHEGTFRYEIGNPNLKSEVSNQIDLAYFLDTDHVSFQISPFINYISNYIYTKKLVSQSGGDSIPDLEEPSPAFKYTSGNALLWGGEVYIDVHPHPLDWLHLENSFSFVEAMQTNQSDSLKHLPMIPAPKYRGGVKMEVKKIGRTFSNFYIHMAVDHFFAQNKVFYAYNTETSSPSYSLLSAGIGADINAFGKKKFASLYINGENLGNIAYQSHLSRLRYAPENVVTGRGGVYDMGRNFSVKYIMNF